MYFISIQVPFLYDKYIYYSNLQLLEIKQAFYELEQNIERSKVVSVYKILQAPLAQINRRNISFPKGITASPQGIADYIMIPRELQDQDKIPDCYKILKQNDVFKLFIRYVSCPDLEEHRQRFMATFGSKSLGY